MQQIEATVDDTVTPTLQGHHNLAQL